MRIDVLATPILFILSSCITLLSASHVLELNDKFLELKGDIPWLVKFYAPWCGYCRRLEPIYEQVARQLSSSPIKVARLDATVYPAVAAAYEVRGYPTIKFIQGSHVETHYGDRTVDKIIQFVEKAQGPAIRNMDDASQFSDALQKHSHEPFFLYIGRQEGALHDEFTKVARAYHLRAYFYKGTTFQLLNKNLHIVQRFMTKTSRDSFEGDNQLVVVVKDDHIIAFSQDFETSAPSIDEQLRQWVNRERYPMLPKLSEMDLYDFMDGGRHVALFVLNESRLTEASRNADRRVFQMAKKLSAARLPELMELQFGYMVDHATANSWAMTYLPTPNLLVVQPSTRRFYLLEDYQIALNESASNETIIQFLNDTLSGRVKAYGGDSFLSKMQRALYDFFTGLLSFIMGSPGVALFVMGIPIAIVSFLVYVICCLDLADEKMDREIRRKERAQEKVQRSFRHEYPLEMRGPMDKEDEALKFSDQDEDEHEPCACGEESHWDQESDEVITTQPTVRERKTQNSMTESPGGDSYEDKKDN